MNIGISDRHACGCTPTVARRIMGSNFCSGEEVVHHFGFDPRYLSGHEATCTPFDEQVLYRVKDTHVLALRFPILEEMHASILLGRRIVDARSTKSLMFLRSKRNSVGWVLIKKTPIEEALSKNWDEQCQLLAPFQDVPDATSLICAAVGLFVTTGERLFPKVWVRCGDVISQTHRFCVGAFDLDGLGIGPLLNNARAPNLAITALEKPIGCRSHAL